MNAGRVNRVRLRASWIEFGGDAPLRLALGCGVTAFNLEEALKLITDLVLNGQTAPAATRVTVDIDISTLDASHVRPNMDSPFIRGVWFPKVSARRD